MGNRTCVSALKTYIARLPSLYSIRATDSECVLETPYYLPDNTRLGVHLIEREDGSLEITDSGETADTLFLSGVNLDDDDRRLAAIRERFGVSIEGGEISCTTDLDHLEEAIAAVVHAMLDMSYLVYTRQVQVAPSFMAEVDNWFMLNRLAYERDVEVLGKANTNTFDYLLPRQGRPLLIEAISARHAAYAVERAQLTSFKVLDSREGPLGDAFEYGCLLDDRTPDHQHALTEQVIRTVQTYIPTVLFWSDQAKRLAALAA